MDSKPILAAEVFEQPLGLAAQPGGPATGEDPGHDRGVERAEVLALHRAVLDPRRGTVRGRRAVRHRRPLHRGGLLKDEVGVGAGDPEGGDAGTAGSATLPGLPGHLLAQQGHLTRGPVHVR